MYATRITGYILATLAGLAGAAQAQGPWPSMNRPSFYSPVQEFFTPRSTTYYTSPQYSQYPSTPIIPGVPQCASGRCRTSCPNGQCSPSSQCANGQCTIPTQTFSPPVIGSTGNCANGSCRQSNNCPNGQCGPGNNSYGVLGLPVLQPARSGASFGFRPLTPTQPMNASPVRGGQINRLIPLGDDFSNTREYSAPQAPMYRDRESMAPARSNDFGDPSIRLQ